MTWPANRGPANAPDEGRRVFLIEMDAAPDALLRALGPFALHEATVTGLDLKRGIDRLELRIEAQGLCAELANRLGLKLQALPSVRAVGMGWTS